MSGERREYDRANLQVPIRYRLVGALEAVWQTAVLTDISASGLRFATAEPLDFGAKVEFEIVLPARSRPYTLIGVVVAEQRTPVGLEYGVAFHEMGPDRQVEVDEVVRFLREQPSGW